MKCDRLLTKIISTVYWPLRAKQVFSAFLYAFGFDAFNPFIFLGTHTVKYFSMTLQFCADHFAFSGDSRYTRGLRSCESPLISKTGNVHVRGFSE
jgi:hypothetical protein